MQAVLSGRLDEEPGAQDVSAHSGCREDHIAQLLLRSKLVEGRLIQILYCHVVEEIELTTV